MADSGTPQRADSWHGHFEEEAAHGEPNSPFMNSPFSLRFEEGSTYTAEYEELDDTTMKEDDGDDESGKGVPIVALSAITQVEGLGTAAGDGETPVSTAVSKMLSCQFDIAERKVDGSNVAGTPTTTAVEQELETTEFEVGDIAVFNLPNEGLVGRRVTGVAAKVMTLAQALPEAPIVGSVIQGTNNIAIEKTHPGEASPTLQVQLVDPLQLMTYDLLGLGGNGLEMATAARNAQKMLKMDFVGADFRRDQVSSLTQPSASRGRSSVNREVWIARSGSAQATTKLKAFNYSFKTNHDTQEVPNDNAAFANGGYHYMLDLEFMLELYLNAAPPGTGAHYFAVWEDGTDNDFQVFIQHGKTAGRLFMLDLVYLILKKPTISKQQKRWTLQLPFKVLTGLAGDRFGTLSQG